MKNCSPHLNQYVDGELEPGICSPFEEHLKDCNPCRIVVDNIRHTIKLYKAEEPFELPHELHDRLTPLAARTLEGQER